MINAYAGQCRGCGEAVVAGAGSTYKQRWQKRWSVYCFSCVSNYQPLFDENQDREEYARERLQEIMEAKADEQQRLSEMNRE